MNAPDPPHWTLNSCFGASCCVWVHFGFFHYCTNLGAKRAEPVQLMQKFVPRSRIGIFATNTPDPPHWTLNSWFRASCSVWEHLAMFCYYTKLGAKWVELVQLMHKFVPWSRIGIFCNKRTRSTPLNPKLMFWCISWCLGAFGDVSLHETRCKMGWTGAINAKVRAMKSHRNFSQRTRPIHPVEP